uniref:TFIIS N-terminal domain-containing protein n=1 Tax=Eutreptiella gymnastica TaxID=73025 RepID=A0A6U8PI91_9EUGL|mmetsp:Transcript_9704/g.17082  ORF Transcript_9704/g.17082 Transcript_9704/m.17082 type:complete len:508 (+) Transcript_9704:72-1595(+)
MEAEAIACDLDTDEREKLQELLSADEDTLTKFVASGGLQLCSRWLHITGKEAEEAVVNIVISTLELLDRLSLTPQLIIRSGIGKTVMKLKKADIEQVKTLAGQLVQKWSNKSVAKTVEKTNTGILRKRSETEADTSKVARTSLSATPHRVKRRQGIRVKFRDESLGEPLTEVVEYEVERTTPMRPVTRKAEVQEERALIESEGPAILRRKAEKAALEARLKAMAPTIAWLPPARLLLADDLETNLSVVGRDSAEKVRLSNVDDDEHHLDNTARVFDGDGPADPPGWVKDQSNWMEPKVNIPDEPYGTSAAMKVQPNGPFEHVEVTEDIPQAASKRGLLSALKNLKRSSPPPGQNDAFLEPGEVSSSKVANRHSGALLLSSGSGSEPEKSSAAPETEDTSNIASRIQKDPSLIGKLLGAVQAKYQSSSSTTSSQPETQRQQQGQHQAHRSHVDMHHHHRQMHALQAYYNLQQHAAYGPMWGVPAPLWPPGMPGPHPPLNGPPNMFPPR